MLLKVNYQTIAESLAPSPPTTNKPETKQLNHKIGFWTDFEKDKNQSFPTTTNKPESSSFFSENYAELLDHCFEKHRFEQHLPYTQC